jgi:NTE family protein
MSTLELPEPHNFRDRVAYELRHAAGRRLGHEAKRLREAGIEVILIQPTVADLEVMGGNLMSSRRRHEVIETAVGTVTDHLRESGVGKRLSSLPQGDPRLVRRPAGPPSTWPDFRAAAQERWTELQAA